MLATVLLPVDSRVFSVAHEFSLGGLPFVFLMLGFSFKMGLVPFHSWLPEAYPAAPAHVSALMSSLMSKLGVYGMLRTVLSFGPVSESAAWIVMLLGILSAVSGITFAVIRRDMKEVLSYSSMENLGIITTGIGLMMLASSTSNIYMFAAGLAAVVFHTLCHSLYKIVLFSAAGIIEKAGFGRDLEGMGGIARRMPRISMVFFGMSWASASLPPYGGLISEILLIISLLAGLSFTSPFVTTALILVLALLVMTGAIALLAWTRTWGIAFSGEPRKAALKDIREEWSWGMYLLWIPLLGLLVLGVFPALVLGWVSPVMDHIAMSALHSGPMLAAWPVACLSLTSTLVALTIPLTLFVGLAGLLLVLRWFLLKSRVKASAKTWSCGWQQPDARVQYTASSFSDPFVSVVRPVLHSEKNEQAVAGYFPSQADSHHHDDDPVRRRLVVRLGVLVNAIFARFAWIQSGNMQQYLLYGLIYLVAMIAWVMVVA
jgi:NADH:ubiquinone oxidoreductase subunit 5 (subunit L)/multisubunit Na+/H+ antiporter MnhA subunit